jgi:hypothetical protein
MNGNLEGDRLAPVGGRRKLVTAFETVVGLEPATVTGPNRDGCEAGFRSGSEPQDAVVVDHGKAAEHAGRTSLVDRENLEGHRLIALVAGTWADRGRPDLVHRAAASDGLDEIRTRGERRGVVDRGDPEPVHGVVRVGGAVEQAVGDRGGDPGATGHVPGAGAVVRFNAIRQ